jgi:AraC-like DNA-binding protein
MTPLAPLPFHRFAYSSELGEWEFLLAPPPPDLVGIVEAFWISRGRIAMLYEKILPQNNIELMFNLERPFGVPNRPPAGRSFRRAWIAGMQQEWLLVTPQYARTEPSYLLSARMPPLGAYRVLDLPLGEIAHDVVELDDALGAEVHRVHERIGNTPEAGLQLAILCDFVRRRLARSGARLHADARIAIGTLAESSGAARIEDLCRSLGVSRKHLGSLFRAHVGLTPKAYARVFRFRSAVDLVQKGRRLDWARVAMACGYYDQAHFNREFREFAGMSPGEFATANCTDGLSVVVG